MGSPTTTEGAVHWKQKRPRCEEQAALRVVRPWRPVCLLVQRVIVVAHCGVRFPLSSLTALLMVRCPVKEESTPLRISHVHEASKSARALQRYSGWSKQCRRREELANRLRE